jgi:DNA-binding IclR family transcriptional regulator
MSTAEGSEPPRRTSGASSSRKVLQLLLAFSADRPEASVAELAAAIGAPAATTYRYVALLKELHLLEEGGSGRYHVTCRVLPLAQAARLANDVARLAKPVMAEAARDLGETVLLFQHFGDSAVCAERVECDRAMRFTFRPGHAVPLGSGASGKMLLAMLPQAERERLGFAAREELTRIGLNGYAVSWGEADEGVWACSVPVHAAGLRATVLSMAGPAARIDDEAKRAAVAALHGYAAAIRRAVVSGTGEFS